MSHIIKWKKPFNHLFKDNLFELNRSLHAITSGDLATDIIESGNDIILEMHIPGIDTDNLKIKVKDTHQHLYPDVHTMNQQ